MNENRIVEYVPEVDPAELVPHELNARVHPVGQREAWEESFDRLGWLAPVVVNKATGRLLDGHLRVEEALARGAKVPVVYVDVDPADEAFVLATFDPIAALAEWDGDLLAGLLESAGVESSALGDLLRDQVALVTGPPDLDDLADEYDPDQVDHGDGLVDVVLRVEEALASRWQEYRAGFDSDDAALEGLLP